MEPYKLEEPVFTGKNLSDFAHKPYFFVYKLIETELKLKPTIEEGYIFLLGLLEDVDANISKWKSAPAGDGGFSYSYYKVNYQGIAYGIRVVLQGKINLYKELMSNKNLQDTGKEFNGKDEILKLSYYSSYYTGEQTIRELSEEDKIIMFCREFRTTRVPLSQIDVHIDKHLDVEPDKLQFLQNAHNILIDNKNTTWKDNLEKFYDILSNFDNRIKKLQSADEERQEKSSLKNKYGIEWNGNDTELLELAYALIESNRLKYKHKEDVVNSFCEFLDIEIKDPDQKLNAINNRSNGSEALFMKKLKESFEKYIKEKSIKKK